MSSQNKDVKEALRLYTEYVKEKRKQGYNPVTALDYSSLYPSLIMTYNLSPEYLILDKKRALEARQDGFDIHEINFTYEYEDSKGNNKSKIIQGWTVRHDESKENSMFGLYPEILRNLFKQRAEMKKSLEVYTEKKEQMESEMSDIELKNSIDYQDCLFQLNYCDTKQKALKVYMNCFYGELGNKNSPLFILELAGGITSAGQANLKKVKKYIEDNGCKTYYGDTDSLYFTFADKCFEDIHKSFLTTNNEAISKEKYCANLVYRTFDLVKKINTDVNDFLKKDNGTGYLKMAYEEVLYPTVFLSRKKYYGIEHKKIANFKPKKMFIRGLEVKKRGVSEILKIICMEAMWESMNIYNYKTLREIVMDKIDYLYNRKWDIEEFVQTGLWKPNKQNQTLIRYIDRMERENKEVPDPYERFNYVIVKIKDPMRLYDFKGRKIDIKKGDKMETLTFAMKNNLEIDLDYYFDKQITGQFARLISYDDEFHIYEEEIVEEGVVLELEDKKTMNACRKYIKEYAKKWNGGEKDYAKMYKDIYRTAARTIKDRKETILKNDKKWGVLMEDGDMPEEENVVIDYRKVVANKAESIISKDCIKKKIKEEALLIIEDMKKNNLNVTRLFSENIHSFSRKIKMIFEEDFEKSVMDFIQFAKDNKAECVILKTSEENILSVVNDLRKQCEELNDVNDKAVQHIEVNENIIKQAYDKLINIASILRSIKLYEEIHNINIQHIEKSIIGSRAEAKGSDRIKQSVRDLFR